MSPVTDETKVVAAQMEEWAAEVSDANAYPNEPDSYQQAMPIVAARIRRDTERVVDPNHPQQAYQQVHVQILAIQLSILVDPRPAWTSDQALYDIVDQLKRALKRDSTLGGRVEDASPIYDVNYDGEAQMADGSNANLARMQITISRKVTSA